jgi:hypothetical protein
LAEILGQTSVLNGTGASNEKVLESGWRSGGDYFGIASFFVF